MTFRRSPPRHGLTFYELADRAVVVLGAVALGLAVIFVAGFAAQYAGWW